MHWTAKECLGKFHHLVSTTFRKRKSLPAFLEHIQTLFLICLDKSKYDSVAIQNAFQQTLGRPPTMFNPLASDSKVAVIAVPVGDKNTSVICNYNGSSRPDNLGYKILRAKQSKYDITIDEA
jgi:hypothetical protein